jgi:glycosyltransferase involved in cell wall biosynthesis
MAATETVTDGMTANFGHYLSLVKYSTHLAAISESAASEFRAFGNMLQAQGLSGPEVTARTLPTEPPVVSEADLEQARKEFNLGSLPIVLVIGSHEPRKNHLCVLEAAESMWRNGGEFELVFAGGSGWGGSTFGDYVRALTAKGYPVRVYERVGEQSLWSLYRLAKFSVFPSLLEGYGLPIAESLVSGTPVITSDHGSMAEVGGPGGSVLVNPRDPAQLSAAMTMLLTDDVWRAELVSEALTRVFPTWDGYSDALWADLVGAHDS